MLPEVTKETCLDFSIENHLEDVIKLRDALFVFCEENGIREKDVQVIGTGCVLRTAVIFFGFGMTAYHLIPWNIRRRKRKVGRLPWEELP